MPLVQGKTFLEAYQAMVEKEYGDSPPDYVSTYNPDIWGCRCFDNELDARKSFG